MNQQSFARTACAPMLRATVSVHLERRIAEERMYELQPHGSPPEWLWQFIGDQPRVWAMDLHGVVTRSWEWLDSVEWHDVAAIRMEYAHGQPIDPANLDDDDLNWFGEC